MRPFNNKQIVSSLCQSNELPDDLNIKDYLGNDKYIKRFGFHILDAFRIDRSILTNSIHTTTFTITKSHMFRMVVFPGRVDTDIELYFQTKTNEDHLISKSNSKQFEDVIAIEILPRHYKMVFRFNPLPSGYNKCEPMKMEFAMQELIYLNTNIQRMYHKYGNAFPQTYPAINILNHFITKTYVLLHIDFL